MYLWRNLPEGQLLAVLRWMQTRRESARAGMPPQSAALRADDTATPASAGPRSRSPPGSRWRPRGWRLSSLRSRRFRGLALELNAVLQPPLLEQFQIGLQPVDVTPLGLLAVRATVGRN